MNIVYLDASHVGLTNFTALIARHFTQYRVVGCTNLHEIMQLSTTISPTLIILSVVENDKERGLSQLVRLHHVFADSPIVIQDFQQILDHPAPYFRSGALGYVAARDGEDELASCIRAVLVNRRFIGNIAALKWFGLPETSQKFLPTPGSDNQEIAE